MGNPQKAMRTNARGPFGKQDFLPRGFSFLQAAKSLAWIDANRHDTGKAVGWGKEVRDSPSHAHHVFPRFRHTAFAGHQRRLFPIEKPFVSGFD